MGTRHKLNPRPNRSYRFAEKVHIQSIIYSVSFGGVCTNGAGRKIWNRLNAAGKKVLVFYCALNRSGKAGFRGTSCHLIVIAEQVQMATGQGCSLSTLKRGLKNLEENGLIIRQQFALYDSEGAPVVKEIRPGEWVTVRLVIVALTDLALSLWSKQHNKGVKMSPRLSDDTSLNPSDLSKVTTLARDEKITPRLLNEEPATAGTPTRLPGQALATVEHEHMDKPAHAGETRLDSVLPFSRGVSCQPPPRPPSRQPRTPETARIRILRSLWYQLRPYPKRIADIAFKRAVDETSREWPAHLPRAVNWGFHFNRWPDLSQTERSQLMRGQIIPALRATTPLDESPLPAIEIQYTDEEKYRIEERTFKRKQSAKLKQITGSLVIEMDPAPETQAPGNEFIPRARPHVETKQDIIDRIKKYAFDLKSETNPERRTLFKRAIEMLWEKVKADGKQT